MSEPFAVCRAAEIPIATDARRWLVRDLWSRAAVGIVGGAPKCCKSWFALDLAVSIASDTPCLGHFEVEESGPTLVFLAEDTLPDVRARLAAIATSRGLDFADLAVDVITESVIRVDLPQHRERLVRTLELRRPRLLLLDPLVRLHRLDENSAQEISGLLGFLREIQRSFDCAVVLVHHASKKQRSRPGQSLRGSSDLHAFGDSNAYLAADGADLVLTMEHRSAAAPAPVRLRLVTEPAPHLEIVAPAGPPTAGPQIGEQVIDWIRAATRPVLRREIREGLRMNNNRLSEVLVGLESAGRIRRESEGWVAAG